MSEQTTPTRLKFLRLAWLVMGRLIAEGIIPLPDLEDVESVRRLHIALLELSWILEDIFPK